MHRTENIEFNMARSFFNEAERNGIKLIPGNIDSSIWLHKENINLDFVIETAKKFSDARIFIISEGLHKGFYIYSNIKESCLKLIQTSNKIHQVQVI